MGKNKINEWTPSQKLIGTIIAAAILTFAAFVGLGSTHGYRVPAIEKKVDDNIKQEALEREQYGKIAASLEYLKEKIDNMDKKIDRHMRFSNKQHDSQ